MSERVEKWTEEPWSVESYTASLGDTGEYEHIARVLAATERFPSAEVCFVNDLSDYEDMQLANAHLIASAPDLAAGAHDVLMGTLSPAEPDEDGPRCWLNISVAAFKRLELALAKARGEHA